VGLAGLAHTRSHLPRNEVGYQVAGVVEWGMNKSKPGLYANINARRKAGTSRPKSQSTISPKIWRLMKAKKGGFEPR